ncbi:MAG: NTP transferase domain-containing protein, partial [Spirochaetes bacterium]|nr:NTP transferase domain-containing protein [Spirochaetota bacterium]
MKAIVLAAGTGSRLGDITKARTKGMVPVKGKKLIDYLFEFLGLDSFERIYVVGGYYYEDLKEHIDRKKIGNVTVLENREYLKGNILTLRRGLEEFSNDSFLVTVVDHIFPPVMFQKMRQSFRGITLMCDSDRRLYADDMKIKFHNGQKSVYRISKELSDYDCGYIGMTYVDASMERTYRDAFNEALRTYGETAVVEKVLQVLADDPATAPGICDLSGFGWYEVDNGDDLRKAEFEIVKNKN